MPVVPPRVAHRWPPARAALAASPAPSGRPPHRRAARRRAARHGLARRRRWAQVKVEWSFRGFVASGPRHGPAGKAGGAGGDDFKRHFTFTGAKGRETLPQRVRRLLVHAGVGLVERQYLLATTGWGNGRWNGSQLAMTEDTCDHRCMCDGGHDAQGATSAKRTGPQLSGYCGLALLYSPGDGGAYGPADRSQRFRPPSRLPVCAWENAAANLHSLGRV